MVRIFQALLAAKHSSVDEVLARKVAQSRPNKWLREALGGDFGLLMDQRPLETLLLRAFRMAKL